MSSNSDESMTGSPSPLPSSPTNSDISFASEESKSRGNTPPNILDARRRGSLLQVPNPERLMSETKPPSPEEKARQRRLARGVSPISNISPVPFNAASLDIKGGVSVGGLSGSVQVSMDDGHLAQLKSSVSERRLTDGVGKYLKTRFKGSGTDYENLAEVIAACVAKGFSMKEDSLIVTPEVVFVSSEDAKGLEIASVYLDGFRPLGALCGEGNVRNVRVSFIEDSPARIIPGKNSSERIGCLNIGGDSPEHKERRKAIAEAVALNMLFGNADINAKGNLGVITEGDHKGKVGCIDFGHAFNSLISSAPPIVRKMLGGGLKHENGILDYINRDTLLGGESKLWRDYNGLITSEEFAAALHKVGSDVAVVEDGMAAASAKLSTYAHQATKVQEKMLLKSLKTLNLHIRAKAIKSQDIQFVVLETIGNLQGFCENRCKEMEEVAKLVDWQVKIDKQLTSQGKATDLAVDIDPKKSYTWPSTEAGQKQFVGTYTSYMSMRQKQLSARTQGVAMAPAASDVPDGNGFTRSHTERGRQRPNSGYSGSIPEITVTSAEDTTIPAKPGRAMRRSYSEGHLNNPDAREAVSQRWSSSNSMASASIGERGSQTSPSSTASQDVGRWVQVVTKANSAPLNNPGPGTKRK